LHLAHSCIDVSDGLLADLQHILSASSVDAEIDCEKLPQSEALLRYCGKVQALKYALTAGDDYCLCMTGKLNKTDSDRLGLTAIGKIKPRRSDTSQLDLINQPVQLQLKEFGYDHFN
jgi:thiamine-monophosphate kinase